MSSMAARSFSTRNGLIAKIHIAKAQLALDDETYRATLQRVVGKTSASDCSEDQLETIIKHFSKAGFNAFRKPLKDHGPAASMASKIRALWISGWNLGVVRNQDDAALEAFVQRQTGIAKVQWLKDPKDAAKVIDALKAWLAREAKVDWSTKSDVPSYVNQPGYRVCLAQWQTLLALGSVKGFATWTGNPVTASEGMLSYAMAVASKDVQHLLPDDFIKVQRALGKKLRAALEGR